MRQEIAWTFYEGNRARDQHSNLHEKVYTECPAAAYNKRQWTFFMKILRKRVIKFMQEWFWNWAAKSHFWLVEIQVTPIKIWLRGLVRKRSFCIENRMGKKSYEFRTLLFYNKCRWNYFFPIAPAWISVTLNPTSVIFNAKHETVKCFHFTAFY